MIIKFIILSIVGINIFYKLAYFAWISLKAPHNCLKILDLNVVCLFLIKEVENLFQILNFFLRKVIQIFFFVELFNVMLLLKPFRRFCIWSLSSEEREGRGSMISGVLERLRQCWVVIDSQVTSVQELQKNTNFLKLR